MIFSFAKKQSVTCNYYQNMVIYFQNKEIRQKDFVKLSKYIDEEKEIS